VVRLENGALAYTEPHRLPPSREWTAEQRFAVRDSLQAWSVLRSAIDCPGCNDHAEADRVWREALR